jgi:hypothetical protein
VALHGNYENLSSNAKGEDRNPWLAKMIISQNKEKLLVTYTVWECEM